LATLAAALSLLLDMMFPFNKNKELKNESVRLHAKAALQVALSANLDGWH
jgi:hypothetical protein